MYVQVVGVFGHLGKGRGSVNQFFDVNQSPIIHPLQCRHPLHGSHPTHAHTHQIEGETPPQRKPANDTPPATPAKRRTLRKSSSSFFLGCLSLLLLLSLLALPRPFRPPKPNMLLLLLLLPRWAALAALLLGVCLSAVGRACVCWGVRRVERSGLAS